MSYSSEVLADSPRGYWRCQESSGNAQDSSGNSNHATSTLGVGTLTYSQSSPITSDPTAKSIKFVNKAFSIPHHTTLNLGDVFTLEAWVRRATTGGGLAYSIISKNVPAYYMRYDIDTPSMIASGTSECVLADITITDTTNFYHLVSTKNGATVKFYINGVDHTGSITSTTIGNGTNALSLGEDAGGEFANHWMTELAVYPTALTQTRVQAHYNAAPLPTAQSAPAEFPARRFGPF